MEAYLDNSATTRVYDEVCDIMLKTMKEDYGNPSAMHIKGVEGENYVKNAKKIIANILKVEDKNIYFTSGGTESNNMALIGTAMANKRSGNHIITSKIEHASIKNTMEYLKEQGFRVSYINVDKNGIVDLEELKNTICKDTILVSIMHVNNEMGAIEPIDEIRKIIDLINPNIIFHVDDIQGFGKIRLYPKRQKIDLLSVSGHKFHGPKGVGFLYINNKIKIKPLIYGGGQQNDLRSGTENVPGIAGIGEASRVIYSNFEKNIEQMYEIKDLLIDNLLLIPGVTINSKKGNLSAPHIVSASFKGIRSEVLLHTLEEYQVYVSAGSACSSNKPAISNTLQAIGIDKDLLNSTIRFSICEFTTREQVEYTVTILKDIVVNLRKYTRN